MKTRILLVVNTVEYGGLERHLVDLARRLDSWGLECTILCYGPDFYSARLKDHPNVRIVNRDRNKSQTFISYWFAFVRLKPHVVVFEKGWMHSYPLTAYLAAKLSGAPRIVAIEHLVADPAPASAAGKGLGARLRWFAGWRARYLLRIRLAGLTIDKTICVSDAVKDALVSEYALDGEKAVTIPDGIDLKYYHANGNSSRKMEPDAEPVIVCVSRLERRKRIDLLLEAFSIVLKEHPSCRCVIVGAGPSEEELRAKSKDLGISSSVDFMGFAEDVRPYLDKADIYVSSSDKEGLGISIIEAMAHKLPCVVTDIGGHNEIVSHGSNGLLVKPGSPEKLAEAINHLVLRREERERMGMEGRKRVEDRFDLDRTTEKIKNVLLETL